MAEGGKQDQKSTFKDPVFKKIARKNGEINKLDFAELRSLAKKLNVNGRGSPQILKKRLKSHYQKLFLSEANVDSNRFYYPYYVVIDFEATCEEGRVRRFVPEIIEFPAVLVDSESLEIKDTFHEYVKPSKSSTLSKYCRDLTGISQEQIDAAPLFPEVLNRFMEWIDKHGLIGQFAIVTDGPWDIGRFLYSQVKVSGLPYPKIAKRWVNIKKVFSNFYDQKKPTLDVMLTKLNFKFEGRRHSGIDDAKNISRVLIQMLRDGASIHVNEKIDLSYLDKATVPGVPDIVKPVFRDYFCNSEAFSQLNEIGLEDTIVHSKCEEKEDSVADQSMHSKTSEEGKFEEKEDPVSDQNILSKTAEESTAQSLSALHLTWA